VPERMSAWVLAGRGYENLALKTLPVPKPGPDQFLARVDAVFACASDGKLIETGNDHPLLGGWDLARWPVSIGHEGCITAVAVGGNLKGRIRVGDAFALQPAVGLPPVNFRERYAQVDQIDKVAVGYTLGGLFAEYFLVQEEVIRSGSLIPYDQDRVPYFAAAFSEPLSCVYSAQNQIPHYEKDGPQAPRRPRLGPRKGGVVLILGAGPMGIIHAEMAMLHRPRAILLSDPLAERRRNAEALLGSKSRRKGIDFTTTSPDLLAGLVRERTAGGGVDDCIVALGIAKVQEEALAYVGKGGALVLFGGTKAGESAISLDARRIHYDGISVVGSSGGDPSDVHAVMRLLEARKLSPDRYVRRVGGLDAALDLFKAVQAQEFLGKGLIYPHLRHSLFDVEAWSAAKEAGFLGTSLAAG